MESSARNTRNICIVAHVDHGKTTLADHLIAGAGDGLVHPKQAGKLRYLDYRDDEQERCITIKSASIALTFRQHLVNLIDSPGHVDFSCEVSSALRVSDGALVLVDACEGVHVQTHAVLRQAWTERVKLCLVVNKLDRLIYELKLSPMEAYVRLCGIVNDVNSIMSRFRGEKYLETGVSEEEEVEFSPSGGNVAFSSALDGWAFRIDDFVGLWSGRLEGVTPSDLREHLWGNFCYSASKKRIVLATGTVKPLFVQCILEPLWQVYNSCMEGGGGGDILSRVIKKLKLSVPTRELQAGNNRSALQAVMSRWLPVSDNVLQMVLQVLPDPVSAQTYRASHLLQPRQCTGDSRLSEELELTRKAVERCDDSPGAPCVVYVAKMFAVPASMIPEGVGDEQDCFLAFARVFSGVLSAGQEVYVLSGAYNPTDTERSFEVATIDSLYVMMGQGFKPVEKVGAGNVVAIRGLEEKVLKSATLSSSLSCWPLANLRYQAAPILRVAVEPSDPENLSQLLKGLKLLNKADPMVQVTCTSTGEYVVAAAGEVHLELCIKELRERFARVEFEVSTPLVAFKETIDSEEECRATLDFWTVNRKYTGHIEVARLPSALIQTPESFDIVESGKSLSPEALLKAAAEATGTDLHGDGWFWACRGSNVLLVVKESGELLEERQDDEKLERNLVSGFELACAGGPLCKEPLWGMVFKVKMTVVKAGEFENAGQVIRAFKEACGEAVVRNRARLVEAMYMCEASSSAEFLGQTYGVLSRRRARVVREEMAEGRDMFNVHALMPVAESFGFAEELLKKTSGTASAQLSFSHWEIIPQTEPEDERLVKKLIDGVRKRKGLPVDEKLVKHAAKQRTLAFKV